MDPEPCVTESLHEDPACVGESTVHVGTTHEIRREGSLPPTQERDTGHVYASCLLILSDTHTGTNRDISSHPQGRRDRRLPWHQSRRSLPVARGCGRAGHAQLGRGGESRDLRLSGADPERERIRRRLTELWDYPKYGAPFKKGGRYFFFKNSGLQNQSVLYTQSALTAGPEVLLDPNTLSSDGTVALSILAFAEDGGRWCTARRAAAPTGRIPCSQCGDAAGPA